ncbi:ABC transporter substrate-binding protein [Corynebacterium terpenotabidum]|nr:ABC transporter substrate-binding protein [Corynebacterium terpenotabidum]
MFLSRGSIRTLSAATAVACALALTACSDDDAEDAAASGDATPGTISITHAFGTTEVPTDPDRAVSFSRTWTDAFAALDEPVAVQFATAPLAEGMPWVPDGTEIAEKTIPVTVTSADLISTAGMEAIAAEDPDVIFAGYLADQETYDELSAIAPTVATVGEGMVDDWREVTALAGKIVDKEEEATSAVEDVDAALAEVATTYPAVTGASFAYAAYRESAFTVITSPDDASNVFFTDLGMVSAADRISGTESGRGKVVSAENLDLLDVDFLALWISGETPDQLPGWSELGPVQRGTAPQLDTITATALGAPSVLSVPWVIDALDPYFAAL